MPSSFFEYAKYCDSQRLTKEINDSEIPKGIDYIATATTPPKTSIQFKEALQDVYEMVLNGIVTNHVATPLQEYQASPVVVQASPSYGDKKVTLVDGSKRKLFARNFGKRFDLQIGLNTLEYTATYPWVKITGVEVVGCENGDFVDFLVYDTPQGTYSGFPGALLNQFAYAVNLPDGFYARQSKFDADMYAGMKITVKYTSISEKNIGLNYLMDEVKA
jgi:hypothetical protein